MKVRLISLIILGLCIFSIIIGLINASKKQGIKTACPPPSQPTFFRGFTTPGNKIALIELEGPISKSSADSFFTDFSSAGNVLKSLERAYEDKSVKAVILRINSPGGTVAMSQEIYDSILKLREKMPVVVSMADVAASGGYYIASAAHRIYANPGTLTGSIGVIMETIDASSLLNDKLGVKSEIIKSGKYKDVGNIYRPLKPDEKELLNNLINNAYKQFLNAIIEGRINRNDKYELKKVNLTKENLQKYADGRIFTGEQALEYGFVDKLGSLSQVEEDIKGIIKGRDLPVVNYSKPSGFEGIFLQMSDKLIPKINGFGNGLESFVPVSRKYPRQPLFIWE